MKANMTKDGQIIISPESPVESYALKMWSKNNSKEMDDGSIWGTLAVTTQNILIKLDVDE